MGHIVNFLDELKQKTEEAGGILLKYLPHEEGFARELCDAMNYSLLSGGKRLRPVLMKSVFELFGGEGELVEPFMAGMEMIHTHSLIHDDLPAIDNDDYRRGRLTTHKVYGEAMGVLSGDALLNYAYETMLKAFSLTDDPARVIRALQVVSGKTGLFGMLSGQSVDVKNDGRADGAPMLEYIYRNKTSALLEASMMAGAILAGADEPDISRIEEAAGNIGMAFQIRDDILDVEGDEKTLGKPVMSDEKNHKVTYVTLYGLDGAKREVNRFSEEACDLIEKTGRPCDFLRNLIIYLTTRES